MHLLKRNSMNYKTIEATQRIKVPVFFGKSVEKIIITFGNQIFL